MGGVGGSYHLCTLAYHVQHNMSISKTYSVKARSHSVSITFIYAHVCVLFSLQEVFRDNVHFNANFPGTSCLPNTCNISVALPGTGCIVQGTDRLSNSCYIWTLEANCCCMS